VTTVLRLGVAATLPFLACTLQWLLWDSAIKPHTWFLFIPASLAGGLLGGLLGGLSSTAISAFLAWYVFVPASDDSPIGTTDFTLSLVFFMVLGTVFAFIAEYSKRTRKAGTTSCKAIFEQAAVGIALIAPDGQHLVTNRKLCEIVGYSASDLHAIRFQEITHDEDLAPERANVQRMLAGEINSFELEKRLIHKNGSIVWVKVTASPVLGDDGKAQYFVSVIEDITSRKNSETQLHEQEQMLNDMSAMAIIGGWSFDTKSGNGNWTPECARIHDLPEDSPIDVATGLSFFADEHRKKIEDAIKATIAEGKPYDLELKILTATGRSKWVRTVGHPLIERGQVVRIIGALQDITIRKTEEEILKSRNLELERFNQASVNRELQLIALKREVNSLLLAQGSIPRYDVAFADTRCFVDAR
jgi:PAS domain S-box-containing protein